MLSDASTPGDPLLVHPSESEDRAGPEAACNVESGAGPALEPVGDSPGPVETSAAALLEAVASGSRSAFEELYGLVMARVYGLCLRLIQDRAIAEEVSQEVLLAVWQQSARFDPDRGSALGWITTLAHRKAVDRIRRTQAGRNRDTRYAESAHTIAVDSTSDAAMDSLEAARVRQLLADMSENQRRALTLAYFDGLTHTQVAHHLGIPLGTAKSRIRDALISLRAAHA